jgi:hypothetical protein
MNRRVRRQIQTCTASQGTANNPVAVPLSDTHRQMRELLLRNPAAVVVNVLLMLLKAGQRPKITRAVLNRINPSAKQEFVG